MASLRELRKKVIKEYNKIREAHQRELKAKGDQGVATPNLFAALKAYNEERAARGLPLKFV